MNDDTTNLHRRVRRASRATRHVLLVIAGATLSCVVSAGMASASTGQADWHLYNVDADACSDAATMDSDYNSYSEDQWFDIDNDCRWDARIYNTDGGDWFAEMMSLDMDENDLPEYVLQDTDQRIGFDFVWYDLNQDGVYESTASLANVEAVAQDTRLKQSNIEAQNLAMIANMPGFVANLAELPTIRPQGLD